MAARFQPHLLATSTLYSTLLSCCLSPLHLSPDCMHASDLDLSSQARGGILTDASQCQNNYPEAICMGKPVHRNLAMKCSNCGHWNRVSVNKIFIERPNPIETKVKILIPMYEPLKTEICQKCGKLIAEPRKLIRIRRK